MAIAIDTSWTAEQSSGSVTTFTPANTHTIGANASQFIFVASAQNVTSITNSKGDTFALLQAPPSGSGIIIMTIGYCARATAGGGVSVTANVASSSTLTVGSMTFTGLASSSILDQSTYTQSNPASGGNIPSGTTGTTQFSNELILSVASEGGSTNLTFTKDASYLVASGCNLGSASSGRTIIIEYQIVSSTGTYSALVTSTVSTSNATHLIATFSDTPVPANTSAPIAWVTA